MRTRLVDRLLAIGLLAASACSSGASTPPPTARPAPAAANRPLYVSGAFDLEPAFKEIAPIFEKETGTHVEFKYGLSNALADDASKGGTVDIYAGTIARFVDQVVESGACLGDTKTVFAHATLVMWANDAKRVPQNIADLKDARYAKIAMGSPEVPYGFVAREALKKVGIWEAVEPRVTSAIGHDHMLKLARSGEYDVTIMSLTHAVHLSSDWTAIDRSLHTPLKQQFVICKGGKLGPNVDAARAFITFVVSDPRARDSMRRAGFLLPGEPLP